MLSRVGFSTMARHPTPDRAVPHAPDSDVYRTLLESTRAIPWTIDWASRTFSYIGPQIEPLLGWTPDSWVTVDDWVERMHPDDRERVVNFCVSQSLAGVDHEADYRAMTRDGRYVWIRDVVHVVRDARGEVTQLVGFMFDITERKRGEEQLAELQKTLETLSYQDGLTGVANRRMFDVVIDREWVAACRHGRPLSLVVFDIDCFKQYNDHYGHLQGDECLRRVARLLQAAAQRPRDVLARFGGEEFVLVLSDTGPEDALAIAERCRLHVLQACIEHHHSGAGECLTVSAGVGTVLPGAGEDPAHFIEAVDRRLYQAKLRGRNRVVGDAGSVEGAHADAQDGMACDLLGQP